MTWDFCRKLRHCDLGRGLIAQYRTGVFKGKLHCSDHPFSGESGEGMMQGVGVVLDVWWDY